MFDADCIAIIAIAAYIAIMASITIRRLDDGIKARLRTRAAQQGHSMEEEARRILLRALSDQPSERENLYAAIRRRIEPLGGVELELPPREKGREPPTFD